MSIYARIPRLPSPQRGEAQLVIAGCSDELRRAKARKDVFAVCSRVGLSLMQDVASEEAGRGNMGRDSVGAQHVGTGMGLGGMKGMSVQGSSRELAARSRVAVVNVIANATANRS